MHRISARQNATLEELHEMTARIEKLSRAEHDLISDVHPQVSEIKEKVENVREVVSSERSWAFRFASSDAQDLSLANPHSQRAALMSKFLLDYFTRLCPNTALKQT
jgi:DNA replication initiation complex subunit (GINS family)